MSVFLFPPWGGLVMKRRWGIATVALALVIAIPAVAGSGAGKCTQDTQTCLNTFSKYASKGWLGLDYDKSSATHAVKKVAPGGPAEAAGFKAGDVLVSMNGVAMTAEKEALKKAKGEWAVGQTVAYGVKRGDQDLTLSVKLAPMPSEVFASMVGDHMVSNHMAAPTAAAVSK
jgi:predicted metalloprotease with PDZ domain